MKRTKFTIDADLEFEYDEGSPEFIEALAAYRAAIYKEAKVSDMLLQVAFHIAHHGTDSMVEGVGYVRINKWDNRQPFSGIILTGEPIFNIEEY